MITSDQLRVKVERLEAKIEKFNAKRLEAEAELKIYRNLLEEAEAEVSGGEVLPAASDAILEHLRENDATTGELADALAGRFHTRSEDPRSAIYAAVDALKKKRLIEPRPGDARRYRLVVREDESGGGVARAAS